MLTNKQQRRLQWLVQQSLLLYTTLVLQALTLQDLHCKLLRRIITTIAVTSANCRLHALYSFNISVRVVGIAQRKHVVNLTYSMCCGMCCVYIGGAVFTDYSAEAYMIDCSLTTNIARQSGEQLIS
jgi:hypothetical protein